MFYCFGVDEPETVDNVGIQLSDIDFRQTPGVRGNLTLKAAWEMMKSSGVATLPIIRSDGRLEGLIVDGDIAYSYMDVYDNAILSRGRTQYKNIIEVLNGHLICGNPHGFARGKVEVATGDDEYIKKEVDGDDLVIVGNLVPRQAQVLEEIPGCMIITGTDTVDPEILKTAEAIDCVVITTMYDAFTTARLINQAIPIRFFMKRTDLVTFDLDDYVDDVRETMSKVRHRDFPILDDNGRYIGMFSRRNLLHPQKKNVILVDHNEKNQAVTGIDEAQIHEVIDHHKIGTLETVSPIYFRNVPLGCCCSIIYELYREKGVIPPREIAGLMLSAIISDTLLFKSPTCTESDKIYAKELAQIAGVDVEEHAMAMFEAGSNLRGKSVDEIFYQDFKTFHQGELDFGVGQISAVSYKQLMALAPQLSEYSSKVLSDRNLGMVFILLTNILDQSSLVICSGDGAEELIKKAMPNAGERDGHMLLSGVVSRKKQVIPAVLSALTEEEDI